MTEDGLEPSAPSIPLDLVATTLVGFVFAILTGVAVSALYPSKSPLAWPIVTVLVGTSLLLALVYLALARTRWLRCADWLVVGYAIGMVLWTGLYMTQEAIVFVHHHTGSLMGVSVV